MEPAPEQEAVSKHFHTPETKAHTSSLGCGVIFSKEEGLDNKSITDHRKPCNEIQLTSISGGLEILGYVIWTETR